jgi:hypothetical protein
MIGMDDLIDNGFSEIAKELMVKRSAQLLLLANNNDNKNNNDSSSRRRQNQQPGFLKRNLEVNEFGKRTTRSNEENDEGDQNENNNSSSPNNSEQQEPQQFCDSFFKKKDFQRINAHTEHALSDDSCGGVSTRDENAMTNELMENLMRFEENSNLRKDAEALLFDMQHKKLSQDGEVSKGRQTYSVNEKRVDVDDDEEEEEETFDHFNEDAMKKHVREAQLRMLEKMQKKEEEKQHDEEIHLNGRRKVHRFES